MMEERPAGTPTPIKLSYGGKEVTVSFDDFNTKIKVEDVLNQFVFINYEPTPANPSQLIQTAPPYTFTHGQRFKAKYKGEEIEGSVDNSQNLFKLHDLVTDLTLYPLDTPHAQPSNNQ